ncbi:MAG: response regulator transcription factor [Vicinamibacterales bacterium]
MTESPIRVLVVDNHRIVREGLALILGREPGIEIIGLAATGEEAVALVQRHRPSVVLMDLQLQGMSGVEVICSIRATDTDTPIIVLTMYNGDEDIHRALGAGATTYLLKDSLSSDDLVCMVRAVHAGERPLPPDVKVRLEDRAARSTLTPREVHVLQHVLEGQRNKEIAASLAISEETVGVHVKHIFAKLGVHDRTAAVYVALRRGIIHIGVGR